MKSLTSKNVSAVFGIAFLAAGILGFFPNPLVSTDGIFEVNFMHNLVHVLTGAVFLFGASRPEHVARITLQSVGIAYVGVSILGFLTEGSMLLGLVHINEADRWLHVGLAAAIVAAGFGLPKLRSTQPAST